MPQFSIIVPVYNVRLVRKWVYLVCVVVCRGRCCASPLRPPIQRLLAIHKVRRGPMVFIMVWNSFQSLRVCTSVPWG